jgi:peptidoglycan-associated lipoprotein
MNIAKIVALTAFTGVILAGCSSTPKAPPVAPAAQPTTPPVAAKPVVTPVLQPKAVPAYLDPNNPISTQRSVYFAFDDYTIKNDYKSLIELQGKYLASNPGLAVKIEGNTDERGGSEYNLALGQKRAEALVSSLKAYGVKDSQMEAVSFGKEKPKAAGHDEAAWAQNRRADIQYPTK